MFNSQTSPAGLSKTFSKFYRIHYELIFKFDIGLKTLLCEGLLLEKVPQDLFHSVYFEYEENSTHDRLLSLNYAFCHIKRLIKTSEPVYTG